MGVLYRHRLEMRSSLTVTVRCATFVGCQVFWFPVTRERNDSSDTRVANITLLDGRALFWFVMRAWPERLRGEADQKSKTKKDREKWSASPVNSSRVTLGDGCGVDLTSFAVASCGVALPGHAVPRRSLAKGAPRSS